MAAYFTCWEPHLGLHPQKKADEERFKTVLKAREPPTPTLLAFVDVLLAAHPDTTIDRDREPFWRFDPLRDTISGALMCFAVDLPNYIEARMLVRPACRKFGLDYYDHQQDLYVPYEQVR